MKLRKLMLRSLPIFFLCCLILVSGGMTASAASRYVSPKSNQIQRQAVAQSIKDCYKYAAKRHFKMDEYTSFGAYDGNDTGMAGAHSTRNETAANDPGGTFGTVQHIQNQGTEYEDSVDQELSYYGNDRGYTEISTDMVVSTNHAGVTFLASKGGFWETGYGYMDATWNGATNTFFDEEVQQHYLQGQILTGLLPDSKVQGANLPFVYAPTSANGLGNGLARLPQGYAKGINYLGMTTEQGSIDDDNFDSDTYGDKNVYGFDEKALEYDTTYMCEDFFSSKEFSGTSGVAFAGLFNNASSDMEQVTKVSRDYEKISKFLGKMGYKVTLSGQNGYCSRFSFWKVHHSEPNLIARGFGADESTSESTVVTPYICVRYEEEPPFKLIEVYQKDQTEDMGEIYDQYNGVYYTIDSDNKGFTLNCKTRDSGFFAKSEEGCGSHFGAEDLENAREEFTAFAAQMSSIIGHGAYYTDAGSVFGEYVFGRDWTAYFPNMMVDPVHDSEAEKEAITINGNFDISNGVETQNLNYVDAKFDMDSPDVSADIAISNILGAGGNNIDSGNTAAGTHYTALGGGLTDTEKELLYRHYLLGFYGGAENTYCLANFGSDSSDDFTDNQEKIVSDEIAGMAKDEESLKKLTQNAEPKLFTYHIDGNVEGAAVNPGMATESVNANTLDGQHKGDYYELVLLGSNGFYYHCYTYPSKNQNLGVFGVDDQNNFFKYVYLDEILEFLQQQNPISKAGQQNAEVTGNDAYVMALQTFDDSIEVHKTLDCYGSDDEHPGLGGVMSIIFCPIIEHASKAIEQVYGRVISTFLEVPSDLYSPGSAVHTAWGQFITIANSALILILVIIIISQVSGIGLRTYGVRAMLPQWIMWAIITNLSFYICDIVLDLTTILAGTAKDLMKGIVSSALSSGSMAFAVDQGQMVNIRGTGLVITAVVVVLGAAIIVTRGGVLVGLLGAFFSAVVAFFSLFLYMGLRQAALMLLVALSPLAFVCNVLPNTKKVFKSWWSTFTNLALVFPICSFLVYGGDAAAKLLLIDAQNSNGLATSGGDKFKVILTLICSVICTIAPIFLIPNVVKNAVAGMNKLAGAVGGKVAAAINGRSVGGNTLTSALSGAGRTMRGRARMMLNNYSGVAVRRKMAANRREDSYRRKRMRSDARAARLGMALGRGSSLAKSGGPLDYKAVKYAQRQQASDAYTQELLQDARAKYSGTDVARNVGFASRNLVTALQGGLVSGGVAGRALRSVAEGLPGAARIDFPIDKAEAIAAVEILQQSEEYAILNDALAAGTASGARFKNQGDLTEFANKLVEGKSANVAAGLYGQFLQESTANSHTSFEDFVQTSFCGRLAQEDPEVLISQDKDTLKWMATNVPQAELDKLTDQQIIESMDRMDAKQQRQLVKIVGKMSENRRKRLIETMGAQGITKLNLKQIRAINGNGTGQSTPGATPGRIIQDYLNRREQGSSKSNLERLKEDKVAYGSITEDVRRELGI